MPHEFLEVENMGWKVRGRKEEKVVEGG